MITLDTESGICYNKCCSGSDDISDSASTRSSCNGSASARRKQNRWDQPEPNHSHGSLLSTMERFVQTVEDMNETILVPCRLMDVKFDHSIVQSTEKDSTGNNGMTGSKSIGSGAAGGVDKAAAGKRLLATLNGTDLFQFYTMLNSVKNNLMWGTQGQSQNQSQTQRSVSNQSSSTISTSSSASSVVSSTSSLSQVSQGQSSEVKGHARRPSTVSTTSSTSASDTEYSELNEDSGVEAEHEEEISSPTMADTFHHHLNGLQQCLCDLTLAADYVTTRYNSDLGGINM